MDARPLFIVVDGLDGCGKSTLVEGLCKELWGVDVPHFKTMEPSLSRVGVFIRNLLHTPEQQRSFEDLEVMRDHRVMAELFAADRLLHQHAIEKAMGEGKHVICDRWLLSSLVYQSGAADEDDPQLMRCFSNVLATNRHVIDRGLPDLVIFLRTLPKNASERIQKSRANWGRTYFEGEERLKRDAMLWEKAVAYYQNVFSKEVLVLSSSRPPAELINLAMQEITQRFPWFPRIPKEDKP